MRKLFAILLSIFIITNSTSLAYSTSINRKIDSCSTINIPVTINNNIKYNISAEYCVPLWNPYPVLQVLVHGGTYNHDYWDWPQFNGKYSYIHQALSFGYATLAIDRIGDGKSTRPLSTDDTYSVQINTLHQVIINSRNGLLGHHYHKIEIIGHSYGSVYAEGIAATYPHDVDAVILTGSGHTTTSVINSISKSESYPANNIPRFSHLDDGYLTSSPGTRADLVYDPTKADPRVISYDEKTEDTLALGEIRTRPSNQGALSIQIRVPVLLMDGNTDNHYCGPDVDNCSSQQSFYHSESPYFKTKLTTLLVNSGHDIQLSYISSYADTQMLAWSIRTLGIVA